MPKYILLPCITKINKYKNLNRIYGEYPQWPASRLVLNCLYDMHSLYEYEGPA